MSSNKVVLEFSKSQNHMVDAGYLVLYFVSMQIITRIVHSNI